MKKIFLILIPAFLAFSCVHDKDVYTGVEQRFVNLETFENYEVPIKAGFTTVITYEDDTLAVASEPMTIKIPKGSVSTKSASALKVDFSVLEKHETYSKYWQAVMFEDTERGDYDYNDLIIHVKNFANGGDKDFDFHSISIQPIALGSIKDIKLGCILSDHSEHIISENVRVDLFKKEKGFINTKNELAPIRYKLESKIVNYKQPKGSIMSIAWFIEVAGTRYYAVTSDFDYKTYNMFNEERMPYGLVVGRDNGTFNYPQEEVSVFNAYPDFDAWVNGRASNIGVEKKDLCYKYSYTGIPGKDGRLYRIWDYLDLIE